MTPFCLDLIVAINNCWNFWLFSIRQLWARRRFDVFVCLLSWWHSVQGSSTASVLLLSQISSFGWALVPRLRPICGSRGPFSRDSMLFFALRRPISRFRWRVLDLLRRCRCLLRFWRFFFLFFSFFLMKIGWDFQVLWDTLAIISHLFSWFSKRFHVKSPL